MKSARIRDAAVLIGAVALTRLLFSSHFLYDIDSVNFALALDRFDPSVHQPHPPGYFLYVCLGRLVNTVFHDANSALVAISIASSCGAAAMIYTLTGVWFGRKAAAFAGLIFLVSPLAWFHGTVALTYIVEAFFSALVGYFCWRVYCGAAGLLLPAGVALGLAAGFRPSSLLFLGPLFLLSLRNIKLRQAFAAAAAVGCTVLAWFVPMIWESGGLTAYISSLLTLWQIVPSRQTVFNSSPATSVARLVTIAGIYVLCFGCAAVLLFTRSRANRLAACSTSPETSVNDVDRSLDSSTYSAKTLFTWVWIAPGSLFFTFIFLKFVNSGYLLLLSPPVFAWLGVWASTWYAALQMPKMLKLGLVGVAAAANVAIFLWAPVYCSYGEVRRFEAELESIRNALPEVASPRDTMIVGFDSHFLGYRHAGFYLPDYFTVEYPELRYSYGTRVFAMQHRDTRLAARLPIAAYKRLIFFPLPSNDKEYHEYMTKLQARFPAGHLQSVRAGGRTFLTGPVKDLPWLFPLAARAAPQVYTELH